MSYQSVHSGSLVNFATKIVELVKGNKTFVLCDNNTKICLEKIDENLIFSNSEKLIIQPGEKNKNITQVVEIWEFLNAHNATKNDFLINIGGGVICDLGGFAASTYKRGISFINIPTSLLGMVDAAIGGKTGFNLNHLKNNIGTFSPAKMVICDADFLATLPSDELKSGFAEVIKHALISDLNFWNQIKNQSFNNYDFQDLISKSIDHKLTIVESDPIEKGPRKKLNFGHTVGHALESYFLSKNTKLLHGYAIAQGMIIESYISYRNNLLNLENYYEIKRFINSIYSQIKLSEYELNSLINLMTNDKKNELPKISFTLLNAIGDAVFDQYLSKNETKKLMLDFIENG